MYYNAHRWIVTNSEDPCFTNGILTGAKGGYYIAKPGDEIKPSKANWKPRYSVSCEYIAVQ